MTQNHPAEDPLSAPAAPRRSGSAWSADDVANIPRRPVGPAEVRTSGWQDVAPLEAMASSALVDSPTEETSPTVFPGSHNFADLGDLREDSTTDATAIPDDEMQSRLRDELRRMSGMEVITLDDSDDSDETPVARPVHVVAVRSGAPAPAVLRETPDFRAMAQRPDTVAADTADGPAESESPLAWVVVGALAAALSVMVCVYVLGVV